MHMHMHVCTNMQSYMHTSGCAVQVVITFNNNIVDQLNVIRRFDQFTDDWINSTTRMQSAKGTVGRITKECRMSTGTCACLGRVRLTSLASRS